MNRQTSLSHVRSWMLTYLFEVRLAVPVASGTQSPEQTRQLTFLAVDLHNACRTFLRAYYVASVTGAWLSTGQRATSRLEARSEVDAINFAVAAKGVEGSGPWRMRDEPAWHDIGMFLRILNLADCSTAPGTNAAWSIGTNALEHLTITRNYFAHRNRETAVKVRNLNSTTYKAGALDSPEELLIARGRNRPQLIVEDWLDDLQTVIELMPA
jgi:hypothetical protein